MIEDDELLFRTAIVDFPTKEAREAGERLHGGETKRTCKKVTIILGRHWVAGGKLPDHTVGAAAADDDVVGLRERLDHLFQLVGCIGAEDRKLHVLVAVRGVDVRG